MNPFQISRCAVIFTPMAGIDDNPTDTEGELFGQCAGGKFTVLFYGDGRLLGRRQLFIVGTPHINDDSEGIL